MLARWTLSVVLLPTLLYTGACAQAPQGTVPPPLHKRVTFTAKYASVFYEHARQYRPVVKGTFPNHQQAQFVLDTGADGMSISNKLAQDLSLSPDSSTQSSHTIFFDGQPLKEVALPNLIVEASSPSSPLSGGTSWKTLTLNGIADVFPQKHANFFGADGVFGTAFLTESAAVFDGPNQEFTFILGGGLTAIERQQLGFSSRATSVALSPPLVGRASLCTVSVILENNGIVQFATLLVDTGADSTSIPRETALNLHLLSTLSTSYTGLAGTQKVERAPVETLKIGNLVLHNVSVVFPSQDNVPPATITPKGGVSETLGMDILSGYRVLIDLPAHMMYIMPSQPEVKIINK